MSHLAAYDSALHPEIADMANYLAKELLSTTCRGGSTSVKQIHTLRTEIRVVLITLSSLDPYSKVVHLDHILLRLATIRISCVELLRIRDLDPPPVETVVGKMMPFVKLVANSMIGLEVWLAVLNPSWHLHAQLKLLWRFWKVWRAQILSLYLALVLPAPDVQITSDWTDLIAHAVAHLNLPGVGMKALIGYSRTESQQSDSTDFSTGSVTGLYDPHASSVPSDPPSGALWNVSETGLRYASSDWAISAGL